MLRNRKRKVGSMAIKVDMSKASYRVEWGFLANMMYDSLLFSIATDRECATIRKILDDYSVASGQVINFVKSTMCVIREEAMLWHFDKSGDNSVRSGYKAMFSPLVAEAMAVLRGILLALERSLVPFVIESDALNVVDLIKSGRSPSTDVGTMISDI
ncbi:hypothetical protein Dsin_023232 [Dipteronia sinensis]|uniref:RNase H type-1 domain-containing protein n=1 Tax=Dipteronia sinensis TaxID=43782 RepID=A0AAE0A3V6_9ROSI|nr:hypothetical protein Dsin_023232 [Dipteronia sinensis]